MKVLLEHSRIVQLMHPYSLHVRLYQLGWNILLRGQEDPYFGSATDCCPCRCPIRIVVDIGPEAGCRDEAPCAELKCVATDVLWGLCAGTASGASVVGDFTERRDRHAEKRCKTAHMGCLLYEPRSGDRTQADGHHVQARARFLRVV